MVIAEHIYDKMGRNRVDTRAAEAEEHLPIQPYRAACSVFAVALAGSIYDKAWREELVDFRRSIDSSKHHSNLAIFGTNMACRSYNPCGKREEKHSRSVARRGFEVAHGKNFDPVFSADTSNATSLLRLSDIKSATCQVSDRTHFKGGTGAGSYVAVLRACVGSLSEFCD
ncbi:hypothetical protein K431DRAFT_334864 [Polychaeton citri CBS 116435]|uniref:Uncharacterized protein n=1 Tax=Polychaeton citri CBS 116435 TaxID=1314669 RepID=A0A9P4PY11_9PEZI|nr:hypothetical protein K431DRAFT_334864 [Polychaeton citri CBS 116435]